MNSKSVSLSSLQSADTIEREIMWPGGVEGTGWIITLAGPGHPKTIALTELTARKNLKRQSAIEAAQVNGKKYKPPEMDVEEQRRDNVSSIVARIVSWRGLKENDEGPEIEFSEAKATEMFMDPKMGWVFWQLVEYLADDRAFMTRFATT